MRFEEPGAANAVHPFSRYGSHLYGLADLLEKPTSTVKMKSFSN
jgi:hypothetical protein